jgi:hypothetical protein
MIIGVPLNWTRLQLVIVHVKGAANFPGSLVAGAAKGVGTKLPVQAGELKPTNASAILSPRIYGTLGLPSSSSCAVYPPLFGLTAKPSLLFCILTAHPFPVQWRPRLIFQDHLTWPFFPGNCPPFGGATRSSGFLCATQLTLIFV